MNHICYLCINRRSSAYQHLEGLLGFRLKWAEALHIVFTSVVNFRQMYSEKIPEVGLKHLLLKYVLSVTFEAVSVLGLDPEQG